MGPNLTQAEGQVFGIGCKIFTIAGPVILYGIFSSCVLGLVYWIGKCFGVILREIRKRHRSRFCVRSRAADEMIRSLAFLYNRNKMKMTDRIL